MKKALVPIVLLLAACPPMKPVERAYPPPTAAELIAAMRARDAHVTSLRADTKVDHMGQGAQRVKVTVALLVARGGKIRMEAESPLGGAIATLVSDGKTFALLDARQNRFLTGPANACNVARLIQLALDPDEVVEVVMGGTPLVGEPAGVSWDPLHGGREVLELRIADGGKEIVKLDGHDRRWDVLSAERTDAGGHVLWRVTHENFRDQGNGVRLPERTTVEEPPIKSDAKIKFREQELNAPAPENLFQLDPPAGIPPQFVDCNTP